MSRGDLPIRRGLVLPAAELVERFTTSGGPGGQHANRSSTRVELRFDIAGSVSLTEQQRERLLASFGGDIRVVVDDERSQARNRLIARERLAARIRSALAPSRTRRPTRPSKASQRRRLEHKRQRADLKRSRRRPGNDD